MGRCTPAASTPGSSSPLATSRLPDGTPLFGQQPLLGLKRGVVRIGDDGATVFRAVHAATLKPSRCGASPASSIWLGSRHYLTWSTDWHRAVAWRLDSGRLTSCAIAETGDVLQFLTVAGHFLIWFAGPSIAVLDLETGGAFDAAVHGRSLDVLAGSEAVIVRSEPVDTGGKIPTGTTVSSLRTATAPGIPGSAA